MNQNEIDNTEIVLELFNYSKTLSYEQENISRLINNHLELFRCDDTGKLHSQKRIVSSLTERLKPLTYDLSVKNLLENLDTMIKSNELFYELEDLYRTLENSNSGMILRPIMQIVLNIINESNDRTKQVMILNELALHTWQPAVKNFVLKYTTNPKERENITSDGGKADSVYSIVEKVNNEKAKGFFTFVGDKWFFISEDKIEPMTPSTLITEREDLYRMNNLQKALQIGVFKGETICFKIDEDLELGISMKNSDITINGETVEKGATLESIFNNPIVPFMRKEMYPIIAETLRSIDKFVDLDIVQKVSNITNPLLECFAFNYKEKMYVYSIDKRRGNNLYEYASATMLVNEMKNQLGIDMSFFFKNKFDKNQADKFELEQKEKFVISKLSEINEGLEKLEESGLIEVNEQIADAYTILKDEKTDCETELFAIRGLLTNEEKFRI